ncbi:GGDEF domain-containing protein [Rhodoferax lacus]|uniref:diguanylate cyclase n=1 Tax=Rhodoferax lacus TaxID=2184758 RepID=A0A3E1RFB5_9BURK|nr:GGDEF domain-containing protein [Rhodoferax lacus]
MASPTPESLVALDQLRLDDARALLDRDSGLALPAAVESPVEYLQRVIDGLCELSLKDPLTGLSNRRHFRSVLDRTTDMVARSGEPALLLMVDIDHFKKVNDTHGHQAGDMVLQVVAQALAKCVRPMDTVARYGGEEFAVVLPNCHAFFGITVAERIRQTIENMQIAINPALSLQVTVSIGGAYAPEWVRSTAALWTERADVQLYRAKHEGRNRVVLDTQQEIFVSAEEKNMLFGHLALGEPAWIESGDGTASAAGQRVN